MGVKQEDNMKKSGKKGIGIKIKLILLAGIPVLVAVVVMLFSSVSAIKDGMQNEAVEGLEAFEIGRASCRERV